MTETPHNNNESENDHLIIKTKQLVTQLFNNIKDNHLIPENIKALLIELNNAYMKMALDTPNLFAFESHQARLFLESACRVSIDWDQMDGNKTIFIKKLESVVKKIKNQETYNNKDYIQYQKDLEKSLITIEKRAAIKKKRQQEKLQGQQKIAEAKENTISKVSQSMKKFSDVSDFISHILYDEWTNVLVLLYIRNGQDSDVYQSKLEFVELLLNLSTHSIKQLDNDDKLNLLIDKYENGLALVAFNKQEIQQKSQKMQDYISELNSHVIAPKNVNKIAVANNKDSQKIEKTLSKPELNQLIETSGTQNKEQVKEKTAPKKPEKISNITNSNDPRKKPKKDKVAVVQVRQSKPLISDQGFKQDKKDYIKIIDGLRTGSWLEILGNKGQKIEAKLSWVSPITGKHLFVDSQGLKISDKTRDELIDGLKNKTIKIIKQ